MRKYFLKLIDSIPLSPFIARPFYEFFSRFVLNNTNIRHFKPSIINSYDHENTPSYLIELSLKIIYLATKTHLRFTNPSNELNQFINKFPGEHYRFLNAIVRETMANNIVEIGTYTGMGTLSLCYDIPQEVKITTYDIIDWKKIDKPSSLLPIHFENYNLNQKIGDLSDPLFFEKNLDLLNEADIIFMDGPKDNNFEYKMALNFLKLNKKKQKYLIIDDIKFVNMVDFWRSVKSPKIDITSFVHWSGTGLIDISDGFKFELNK